MSVLTITAENFKNEIETADVAVVDFWASWCGPCKMMSPVVDHLAETNTSIKVGKINVDDEESLASQFGVMTIPTIVCFKNGTEVGRAIGVRSEEDLKKTLGL